MVTARSVASQPKRMRAQLRFTMRRSSTCALRRGGVAAASPPREVADRLSPMKTSTLQNVSWRVDQRLLRWFQSTLQSAQPIGVGRADWFRLPLPPNRTGGFPASGSPVGGFTSPRIVVLPQWLIQVLSTLAPQSMHSASVYGPASSSLLLAGASASAGSCEAAFGSTGPAV